MMRFRLVVLSVVLALAGCSGPQIVAVQGTGAQSAIEQHSLQIVFSGKTSTGWTKHERSAVQTKPTATEQEQQLASVRCKEIGNGIVQHLRPMTKSQLAPYLSASERDYRNVLTVEINRIMADTDGSADIVVTLSYGARGNEKPGWSRIVHIQASRFATGESVARELADATLAQLKASALVQ
ncbi:hypothetical protein [Rugamonas aquatica]|uniref:Lipoprotein n=1 Tax=Rugamonas aquatica TaxID=2743357 RepID=A0A6A7MY61_9BURK|nr:hypothetical protein [Rugamonas aquatica]MQA37704.1 hypothetical protein [Rugamonas aquatica]